MIALEFAKKNILDVIRDFKSVAIIFLLPIIFIGIFGLVFGKQNDDISFDIAVVQTESIKGNQFYESLKSAKNGSDKEFFEVKEVKNIGATQDDLEKGRLVASIEWNSEDKIVIRGDGSNSYFTIASGIITQFYNAQAGLVTEGVTVDNIKTQNDSSITAFDLLVPGLLMYGILMILPQVIHSIGNLYEKNYTFRIFTSHASAADVIIGNVLSNSVLVVIQTALLYGAAFVLGFKAKGSILDSIVITLILGLFVIGLGLLLGAVFKKVETAQNFSTLLTVVFGFLSGSFVIGVKTLFPLFTISGREIHLSELFPTMYATDALTSILVYGRGLADLKLEILVLLFSSLLILLIGIILFGKYKLHQKN